MSPIHHPATTIRREGTTIHRKETTIRRKIRRTTSLRPTRPDPSTRVPTPGRGPTTRVAHPGRALVVVCRAFTVACIGLAWLSTLATSASAAAGAAATGPSAEGFAGCRQAVEADPQAADAWRCFYDQGRSSGDLVGAWNALSTARSQHGDLPPLLHNLARVAYVRGEPSTPELFRAAAEGYAAQEQWEAAVSCRISEARWLRLRDRFPEAKVAAQEAQRAAEQSEDPWTRAKVTVQRAELRLDQGADLDQAVQLLERLQHQIDQGIADGSNPPPYTLQRDCLLTRGNLAYQLGRYGRSRALYARYTELVEAQGDLYATATGRYNQFNTYVLEVSQRPEPGDREQAIELARRALDAARVAEHRAIEAYTLSMLGRLEGGAEGQRLITRCLELLGDAELYSDQRSKCLRALAENRLSEDPEQAEELLDEALRLMLVSEAPWPSVHGWEEWMGIRFATASPQRARDEGLRVLELIETLQREQDVAAGRQELFAVWTEAYYWLAGRLFERSTTPTPPLASEDDLRWGFEVGERMRARVLREALGHTPAAPHPDHHVLQAEILRQSLGLTQVAGQPASPEEATTGDTAPIEALSQSLEADEALLVYQLGLDQGIFGRTGGGAWLTVIHSQGVKLHRLPGREVLDSRIRLVTGLLARGDGEHGPAARRLFDDLLAPALADLPSGVEHLILVADGSLLRLPFGALIQTDGQRVAETFRLSLTPSATLWLEGRRGAEAADPAETAPYGVLVLADPASQNPGDEAEFMPLPYARKEGRSVVRQIGGTLWTGSDAGEDRLRDTDLSPYAVVHLAAHAVADPTSAESSFVRLAADGRHDGDLRPSEITSLDFEGRLVVLSACRGADGRWIAGEGVQSLSRAFFEAGAEAVVAGLWPLRDDQAARLVDRFYRALARGDSVAEALAKAQRHRIEAGDPPAAWAAWQVLGNGGWRLERERPESPEDDLARTGHKPPSPLSCGLILLGIAFAGLFTGLMTWRRRG